MAVDAAQPAVKRQRSAKAAPDRQFQGVGTTMTGSTSREVGDNINTARYLEGKFLIGHSGVFLQIREGKPRLAALSVDRHQPAQLERLRAHLEDQPVVLLLCRFGHQL